MKKMTCLLLTLCLCAGMFIPAYSAETEYASYTVSGVDAEGTPFRITFSAVRTRKATVTNILETEGDEDETETYQLPVTVLTLCPGSIITVGAGRDDIPALRGRGTVADGFRMDAQEAALLSTGPVDTLFHSNLYNDGFFLNTAGAYRGEAGETYLLELGADSPDGYRAFPLRYSDGGEGGYTFTFTAAKAETRPVTLRYATPESLTTGGDGTEYSEYETIEATVIKVKAGSMSRIVMEEDEDWGNIYLLPGEIDEQGRYTVHTVRASGRMYWTETDSLNGCVDDYLSVGFCYMPYDPMEIQTDAYLIQLDDACPFEDVRLSDYYAQSVLWAVNRGVTLGTSARTFSPALTCTRAQILTFIWRYQGQPEPRISNPFGDVSPENYYYNAALWAYEKGMVSGAEFRGDELCTRAAAVTYLWILAGKPQVDSPARFEDVPSGASYAPAVKFAVDALITNGTSDDTFSPERTCTRGNIVTFLLRYNKHLRYAD